MSVRILTKSYQIGLKADSPQNPTSPKAGRSVGRNSKPRESLKTIAFDSVGDKKFALQVQRAHNGNPCLRIVQGTPQQDGTYRKFDLTFWSEDWDSLFEALDEMREFIDAEGIATPKGHKWTPPSQRPAEQRGRRPARS